MTPSPRCATVAGARRAFALLGALTLTGCAATIANPRPGVVWVSHERAYVALPDTAALEPGDRVEFTRRGRAIAAGTVIRVVHGEMALVTLTSGRLTGVRKLSDVEVTTAPAAIAPAARLRVGLPSARRGTPFFTCERTAVRAPGPLGAYREGAAGERTADLVRDPAVPLAGPWPDTLSVRWFDDAADQEIALERGEIDAAVFWPGELSAHMRRQPRWQGFVVTTRSYGGVALVWTGEAPSDSLAKAEVADRVFAPMNRDLFRGDLEPLWPGGAPGAGLPGGGQSASPARGLVVDLACPGRGDLQRYLDRSGSATSPRAPERARLVYLDALYSGRFGFPNPVLNTLPGMPSEATLKERADRLQPLFGIGCPIVCAPELRGYVRALGHGLADLMDCRQEDSRR